MSRIHVQAAVEILADVGVTHHTLTGFLFWCIFRVFLGSNLKMLMLFLIRIYFITCVSAVNFSYSLYHKLKY